MQNEPNRALDADDDLDALVDPDELARARRGLGHRRAQARFAAHLMERAPNSILGRLMLARLCTDPDERLRLLDEAVSLGLRRWAPELDGRNPPPCWTRDGRSAVFVASVMAYGTALAECGRSEEADVCLRLSLRLDPDDEYGAGRGAARNDPPAAPIGAVPGTRG